MSLEPLSTIEIPAKAEHLYSIIWLHGLGADGHDFENLAPELQLTARANIRFIFPNAPVQPVTINGGTPMRSWYDILSMTEEHEVNTDDINQSAELIESLIQKEVAKGIAPENILLAGFSQGGVIALHTGLKYPLPLAGIVALSTYLPTIEQLKNERSAANQSLPIFIAHGIIDPIVAVEAGKAASDALQAMGYNVEWHDYLMEHSLCIEEIEHISAFINLIFK